MITSTVANETWAENGGGQAEIRPFPTNLSLVISQTQAVHEQIADLLEQLRRLQDLQVTIEVRFIRLNDSFFERIGVDFQANIKSRTTNNGDLTPGVQPAVNGANGQKRQTSIVGYPGAGLSDESVSKLYVRPGRAIPSAQFRPDEPGLRQSAAS